MGNGLVVHFSVHGSTARAARTIASLTGADIVGIRPVVPRGRGQVPGADHRPTEVSQQTPDLPSQMRRPRVVGEGENPVLPVDFEQCTSHDPTR